MSRALSAKRLRASNRSGRCVMTQPPSLLNMLLSRHTKRREFITLVGGAVAAWPLAAQAQQPTMPVIGVLSPVSVATSARSIAALRQGLRDLGYIEGRNIKIEYRFAEGIPERLIRFASELTALKTEVIAVGSTSGIVSASKVTQTVPLIMIGVTEDPVAQGLAQSFARPGGNVTGFLLIGDQEIREKGPATPRCRSLGLAGRLHRQSRFCGGCRRAENGAVGGWSFRTPASSSGGSNSRRA